MTRLTLQATLLTPRDRCKVREELGIPDEAFVVVFCGRLDQFKNPLLALDIADGICRKRDLVFFIFLGDGPLRAEMIHRISSFSMRHHVRLLGFVNDVPRYLQAADLYLSTSSSAEGFGLAPAEALSTGVPILVPDVASFRYAFGACSQSTFVKGTDPMHWSHELNRIADSMRVNRPEDARRGTANLPVHHLGRGNVGPAPYRFYKPWSRLSGSFTLVKVTGSQRLALIASFMFVIENVVSLGIDFVGEITANALYAPDWPVPVSNDRLPKGLLLCGKSTHGHYIDGYATSGTRPHRIAICLCNGCATGRYAERR